ncbi:single-stranded DNA-binding protein [Candidatus Dojkabacteria bacterium]|nr:single-stranded DNA-binding protein [Candidatus Dojkabacteria bacterium]
MASRSLNKVLLIGNLTRDPEIRYTSSGAAMCSFGVATNRSWKDSEGEIKEEAEFHNLVAWNKMAEVCYQILAKGMKVYIEGELRTRSWESEGGDTRYRTEIKVNEMILLDSRGKSGVGGGQSADDEEIKVGDVVGDDDSDQKEEKKKKPAKKGKKDTKKDSKEKEEKKGEEEADILDDDLPF